MTLPGFERTTFSLLLVLQCMAPPFGVVESFSWFSPASHTPRHSRFLHQRWMGDGLASFHRGTNASVLSSLATANSKDTDIFNFGDEDDGTDDSSMSVKTRGKSRWESLNPAIKARIIKQAQKRAIANKAKREPPGDKKRRK
jgi:hypothetical protein